MGRTLSTVETALPDVRPPGPWDLPERQLRRARRAGMTPALATIVAALANLAGAAAVAWAIVTGRRPGGRP